MEAHGENQGRMAASKGLEVNNHVNGYTTMKEMLFQYVFEGFYIGFAHPKWI